MLGIRIKQHGFIYILCIIAFIFKSCNDEDVQPTEFPIVYNFFNDSDELKVVNFTTYTYYPNEDKTLRYYEHFKPVLGQENIIIAVDDSQEIGRLGYEGCIALSEFEIWIELPSNQAYVSEWRTPTDTIKKTDDALISYEWPQDTLKWEKVRGIIIDL